MSQRFVSENLNGNAKTSSEKVHVGSKVYSYNFIFNLFYTKRIEASDKLTFCNSII